MTPAFELAYRNVYAPAGMVGAGAIVTAEEIQALNAKILELDTNIQQQSDNPFFKLNWDNYRIRWEFWRNENGGGSLATPFIVVELGPEFDQFSAEYNELLRQAQEQGILTNAQPHQADVPVAERALSTLRTIAWPVAIGAGLFFLWQSGILARLGK